MALPEFNRLVLAKLDGASHHTGDYPAWHREGWAFMVRWDDSEHTIVDGWARDRYEAALQQIHADYASVVEWVYVSDLTKVSEKVESPKDERILKAKADDVVGFQSS